ncbi:MAG: hypothetical protein KA791_01170 [Flavobacteriales bacterium]|nr:hypothetical protein [Flavobacteriales bacterium]
MDLLIYQHIARDYASALVKGVGSPAPPHVPARLFPDPFGDTPRLIGNAVTAHYGSMHVWP